MADWRGVSNPGSVFLATAQLRPRCGQCGAAWSDVRQHCAARQARKL